ncbi:Rdx family-domain-containing protein [Halteromyces radiatus]|uniref:Rdx family-domain-containing protein n=1 Tax=Halteromyces radiatus TaxID=101107 RepID=UPI00221EA2E0|nr:Rdx family-domain-containing protein [Halteromyces radiatus]KAI8098641.1 Rdx family-domain-containing protein [Halteromyces radiatus]
MINNKPQVSIEYCPKCRWLLRASWLSQELLTTFENELGQVSLIPGDTGVFLIKVNDVVIWDRKQEQAFPEAKILKQKVRDLIAPQKSLGHSDVKKDNNNNQTGDDQIACKTCPP